MYYQLKVLLVIFISGILSMNPVYADDEDSSDRLERKEKSENKFKKGAVFVMTNDVENNEVAMYGRAKNGKLLFTGKVSTGGTGSLNQPIDPLGSNHSIILTEDRDFLLASNAGSSEISVFSVDGYELELVDKVPSNGIHPVSIAVNDDLVYVLNTGGDGAIAGFRLSDEGKLNPIEGSIRSLENNNTVPPPVNDANHHIVFNPYGDRLLVSGGLNTNMIKVYSVDGDGLISAESIDNVSAGPNPFSLLFTRFGDLIVAESEGSNAVSSYDLRDDNSLSVITKSVFNGNSFSCWLVNNGNRFIYLINTGTDNISLYETTRAGEITLVNSSIISLGAGALETDAAFSDDGKYLYTLNGGTGKIGVLDVNDADGSLELIQQAGGLEDTALLGPQGIAAY